MNFHYHDLENVQIALVRVDELKRDFPHLLDAKLKNSSRLLEKEGVKLLIETHLTGYKLDYLTSGKPFLRPQRFISISHSKSIVGIAWSDHYNIGLDIEEIHPRIRKVESRFINTEEISIARDDEFKTIIWCIKEAMIKILDNKSVDFKNEFRVSQKNSTTWMCEFLKPPITKVDFFIFNSMNNIICINTTKK